MFSVHWGTSRSWVAGVCGKGVLNFVGDWKLPPKVAVIICISVSDPDLLSSQNLIRPCCCQWLQLYKNCAGTPVALLNWWHTLSLHLYIFSGELPSSSVRIWINRLLLMLLDLKISLYMLDNTSSLAVFSAYVSPDLCLVFLFSQKLFSFNGIPLTKPFPFGFPLCCSI